MCNTIVVNNGEVEIETPQEFVDYFHKEPVKAEMHSTLVMDACLCQVDIEESLSSLKLPYECDGMDYNLIISDK
ncbi:hypothetical protein JOE44_001949 [Chryseobacterium sp. PvR013]|uniref:hypothetical protein n=1 Tax=Chryseobacterium sp. PvR013 TaxID=2806595 RepID=UPI001AE5D2A8|nr:hypothetical protein [Chryseobacterium sp. PvR013]MBP1165065.1 hypothetical protein [Chryseobacterium sp. PvR013]